MIINKKFVSVISCKLLMEISTSYNLGAIVEKEQRFLCHVF